MFVEFINTYGVELLKLAATAIFGYLGLVVKSIFKKIADDKRKENAAKTAVRAVEQIYKDLHGEEKLNKAIEAASEMLFEKGITITELEIRMLIEAAVAEFNDAFNKDKNKDIKKEEK